MDLFGFLDGISAWWWIAGALALAIIEVLTFSFFLIWPGLAALAVGILMWIFPDMSGNAQVLVFSVFAVLFTWAGRVYVMNRKPTSDRPGLNDRASQMIGRHATVVDGFAGGAIGNVEIDGIRWRARLVDGAGAPEPGDVLPITGADGMTLILTPKG